MATEEKGKTKIPDGNGGWQEVEYIKTPVKPANEEKRKAAFDKAAEDDFYIRVGRCTESLSKFLRGYARDYQLTRSEIAAAVYLENCNNKYFFPKEDGGKEQFETICKKVWDWFKKQVAV